jgi:excisionase family DNA binding protein
MPKVILDVKLYSLQEAADLLGVTKQTISKYIKSGRITATLIGGKKYLSEDNIKSFLLDTEAKIK